MSAKLRCLVLCLLTLFSAAARGATLNVGQGQAYTTIQSAINAANNGDIVLVGPGTYYENIDFKGKAITVTSSAGPATTIIDGGGKIGAAVVQFITAETRTSIISNFTIRNGGTVSPASFSPSPSGGVYAYRSAPTIASNVITANLCNAVISDSAAALIQSNTITATIGNVNGGCILENGSAILVDGYDLNFGSGIVPTILGNTISDNVQGTWTGGVYLWSGDHVVIQNNIFRNNFGEEGGAISSANTNTVSILQNLFYNNSGAGAGAINLQPPGDSVGPFVGILAGNTIWGNSNTSRSNPTSGLYPSQVNLSGNLAQYLLVNNIIVGTQAGFAAIACNIDGYSYLELTPLVFDHNDIYAAQGQRYVGTCADQTGIFGNLSADPQFTSPATGDFRLSTGSPAIDFGNNSAPLLTTTDFAGDPRVQDGSGKGYPVVDLGAYESAGAQTPVPTILTLTPSEYFDSLAFPYTSFPPLTFAIQLASSAGTPTGPVTLYVDGNVLATVEVGASGTATYGPAAILPGLHAFTASYPGATGFPPAISVKFYLEIPPYTTTLALTSSSNPALLGTPVTFTATITSTDGTTPGPITIKDSESNSMLATLTPNSSGVVSYTTSSLAVGTDTITAAFAGDSAHAATAVSLVQTIDNGLPTTTAVSCPATIYGYGSGSIEGSVSSAAGVPGGSLTLTDNGTSLAQLTLSGGSANYTYSAQTLGTHTIAATYLPTGNYAASSATCSLTVALRPATVTLTSSPNPSSVGQSASFTATVVYGGPPQNLPGDGSITFYDGNNLLGTVNVTANGISSGTAVFSTSTLSAGNHTMTATLTPFSGYQAGSASLTQTVNGLASVATLSVTPTLLQAGQTATLTARIAAYSTASSVNPSGTVVFYSGSTALGSVTLTNGVASLQSSSLAVGNDQLTCQYSGDASFAPSACNIVALPVAANPTALTLTSSPNPALALTPITFTAHLTSNGQPVANQTVLLDIPVPVAPLILSAVTDATGTATFALNSGLAPHLYPVAAASSTSGNLLASSAALLQTVVAATSQAALNVSPNPGYQGQTITLAATLTANNNQAPTGSVTFLDGNSPLATASLAGGKAVLTTQLAAGVHSLSVSYAGDTNTSGSASAPVPENILPSDFTLATTPAALSLVTGHHLTFTLTAASVGIFNDRVQLSTANLPAHATVQFSPAAVGVPQAGQATSSVYLDTDDVIGYLSERRDAHGTAIFAAMTLPWLGLLVRRRKLRLSSALACVVAVLLLTSGTGCSGKYPASTAPGSYTLQITAVGATTGTTHTLSIPFTVTVE